MSSSNTQQTKTRNPDDLVLCSLFYLKSHRYPRNFLRTIFAYATNFIYETNDAWLFRGRAKRIYKFTEFHRSRSTLEDLYDIQGITKDVAANIIIRSKDFDKLEAFKM